MPHFMEIGRVQDGEHLQKELDGMMSREQILLLRGPLILPGTVLGLINEGAQSVVGANGAGMVGNSTFTVGPTADADAPAGVYRGLFLDADTIQLNGPGGYEAIVQLGAAHNGPTNFTRTAGATPHAAGDFFTITVSYAAKNLWAPLDLAGVDGRETAAGVLYAGRKALTTADTRRAVAHVRSCDFNGKKLTWPVGITENQRKAQEAILAKTFALVRY
jgi:hypothetical protein